MQAYPQIPGCSPAWQTLCSDGWRVQGCTIEHCSSNNAVHLQQAVPAAAFQIGPAFGCVHGCSKWWYTCAWVDRVHAMYTAPLWRRSRLPGVMIAVLGVAILYILDMGYLQLCACAVTVGQGGGDESGLFQVDMWDRRLECVVQLWGTP